MVVVNQALHGNTKVRGRLANSHFSPLLQSFLTQLVNCCRNVHFPQWSFGVTCWEVFSGGKNPYSGIGPMAVVELLERGERMTPPNNAACTKKM